MLRREPTKITLTMDDILACDARKAQRDQEARQQEESQAIQERDRASQEDPFGGGFTQRRPDREARTREQRIGVGNSR